MQGAMHDIDKKASVDAWSPLPLNDAESVNDLANGDGSDLRDWLARQEQMMKRLSQQQEHYSANLLERIEDLSSRQDACFQQLLEKQQEQQQSVEKIVPTLGHWRSEVQNNVAITKSEEQHLAAPTDCSAPSVSAGNGYTDLAGLQRTSMQYSVVPSPQSAAPRTSSVPAAAWNTITKGHSMKPFDMVHSLEEGDGDGSKVWGRTRSFHEEMLKPGWRRSKKLIRHPFFEPLCTIVLCSNALFIGVQVEYRAQTLEKSTPTAFEIIDILYTAWFVLELFFRGSAVGCSRFFTDPVDHNWNIFDLAVVVVTLLEKFVSSAFGGDSGLLENLTAVRAVRVFRVARVARVIRVMTFFRSFRILCSALFSTAKSCLWTSVLLTLILYMFALVFAQAVADYRIGIAPEKATRNMELYFGSLAKGMYTLFKSMVGGIDWEIAARELADVGPIYVGLFVVMLVFISLALMNVMSGLFLQNALEQATSDREDVIHEQLKRKQQYVHKVVACFNEMDKSGENKITLDDFESHLQDRRMVAFFDSLEIEMADAWTLFKLLDVDGGGTVSISEFVDGVLRMRGTAKSVHLAQLMFENKWQMEALAELTKLMDSRFRHIDKQLVKALKEPAPPVHPSHHNLCKVATVDVPDALHLASNGKSDLYIKSVDLGSEIEPVTPDLVKMPEGTLSVPTSAPLLPCELAEECDT